MQKISTNYIKHVIIVDIFANVKCILSAEPPWKFQVGTNGLEAEVRAQVSVISKAGEKTIKSKKLTPYGSAIVTSKLKWIHIITNLAGQEVVYCVPLK